MGDAMLPFPGILENHVHSEKAVKFAARRRGGMRNLRAETGAVYVQQVTEHLKISFYINR